MSALIRAFDWTTTPLGDPEDWPAELKCVAGVMLRSDVPMTMLWGREGIMIYNDAYQAFAGGRHPSLLGAPVLQAWPEVADFNANVLKECLGGNKLSYLDQHLMLMRRERLEDVWLSLDYSPIIDSAGTPAGVLAVVRETTAQILAEQKLKFAQEVGGVGIFEWYPESGRMEVSDQYRRVWGLAPGTEYDDEALIGLVHPDDRHKLGPMRVQTENPISYAEYRVVNPSTGELRWIARRGEPVLLDTSDRRRYIGIVMDITERKLAEEATVRSEFRWRELFDRMQEGFFVGHAIRDSDGKMIDFMLLEVNPAFGDQTGIDSSDAVGRSVRELIPTIDDSVIDTYADVIATGKPVQFELHVPALENRWFEARARRLDADRFAVLFVEISARKKAEAALRESEERFRLLAQTMPNQVWTADPQGQLDWFNDRFYAYLGAQPGTLDGGGWSNSLHEEDVRRVLHEWDTAVASGNPYSTEFRLRGNDGAYRWHIAKATPVRRSDGSIERWVGNNVDIEDQKAAEVAMMSWAFTLEKRVDERTVELLKTQDALRQAQKMEAIGNLTGGVAHDFNNLLQVISGNLQLLADDVRGNARAQRRADNAMAGVARGSKLASQLLSFGRRQPLAPRVINPARLIRDMDDLLRRSLGEEIELETVVAGGLWNTFIDAANLENALLNLAINARDAMNGLGRLTIEAGNSFLDDRYVQGMSDVKAGQYVLIAITDTGSGMSAELMDKVFEPFFTTKPEGRGTGLGLSMVYGFVKQSGGHIKIYSELGHGTTVRLYLPRSTRDDVAAIDVYDGPVTGGHETILVAEDDHAVRETVVELLGRLGYRVLQASDAQGALSIVQSGEPIDLLLTDVVMPGDLRSPELARLTRERIPGIAVLFMSGYTENAIVHGGRLDEGVDLLSKPYTNEALARKVRNALSQQKQRNQDLQALPAPLAEHRSGSAAVDKSSPRSRPLNILLCEDDAQIRRTVVEALQGKGHQVAEAASAEKAIELFKARAFDVLITDVGLPDRSGLELARLLQGQDPDLPVVFATGRYDEEINPTRGRSRILIKPYGAAALAAALAELTGPLEK